MTKSERLEFQNMHPFCGALADEGANFNGPPIRGPLLDTLARSDPATGRQVAGSIAQAIEKLSRVSLRKQDWGGASIFLQLGSLWVHGESGLQGRVLRLSDTPIVVTMGFDNDAEMEIPVDELEGSWRPITPGGMQGDYQGAPAVAAKVAEFGNQQNLLALAKGIGRPASTLAKAKAQHDFKPGDAVTHTPSGKKGRFIGAVNQSHAAVGHPDGTRGVYPLDDLTRDEFGAFADLPMVDVGGRRNLVGSSAAPKVYRLAGGGFGISV